MIEVPTHPGQITYSRYLDFKKEEEAYMQMNLEDQDDQAAEYLAAAVTNIVGDCSALQYIILGDDIGQMIKDGYMLPMGEEISTTRLYVHIISMISQYDELLTSGTNIVDGSYKVDFEGETYYIDPMMVERHFGSQKGYTTGEVVEIKSLERELRLVKESQKDLDGGMEFGLSLKAMAILLRRKGELLPLKFREREAFLTKRAELFAGLPMDVVLGTRFFFRLIIHRYLKTLI